MPFIVLGVVIAGILEEFVPQQAIAKIIPSNWFLAILLGGLLGLVFPMCECGIIVVMRRLLRKGLPLSMCICYMLAGPIINVVVMLSTYVAFDPGDPKFYIFGGPQNVVLLRVGLAYVVAVVTASAVEWLWRREGTALLHPSVASALVQKTPGPADDEDKGPRTFWDRLNNITGTALHDFIEILTFLILGAILAAVGRLVIRESADLQEMVKGVPAFSVLMMMVLAVLFCLCSEADAFVAANFDPLWPPASKLSFLVLGPMLDIKLYLMYTRVFRPRLIITIITLVVIQVFFYLLALHYIWASGWLE